MNEPSELAKRIAIENVALTVASHYSGYAADHAKLLSDAERVIREQITAPLESELASAKAEAERLREDCQHFQSGHAEIARGVKAGLGLENWPHFTGKFQDGVARLVREVVSDNAALRQQVEELRRLLMRHRTIFIGTVGFGAIVSDINSALAATEPTSDGRGYSAAVEQY